MSSQAVRGKPVAIVEDEIDILSPAKNLLLWKVIIQIIISWEFLKRP